MEIPICNWRIATGDPIGLLLWFDPSTEVPSLSTLTKEQKPVKLDRVISVRAMDEDEDSVVSSNQLGLAL